MPNLEKVAGERNLYRNPTSGSYFLRVTNPKDNFISLGTKLKTEALKRVDARRAAEAAAKLGIAIAPQEVPKAVMVTTVLKRYADDGYPDKRGIPRPENVHRRALKDANALLNEFFKGHAVDSLSQDQLDAYHEWRQENVRTGDGHRTTDLELNALNNAINWAIRKTLLKTNPIQKRVRYHSSTNARHCRALAPANADELHDVASHLFSVRQSEVLGWQLLFESLTGLRTNEALALRMDARSDEPGGLTSDGGSLCVRRSKKAGRDNPYLEVHDGLKAVIKAHGAWHKARYPLSPWYFPGRDRKEPTPVAAGALTKSLDRLFEKGALKKKFTSHGARAFYVLIRRSQGISDTQIAVEVNHIGGVGTLEKVYGGVPPSWRSGSGPKLGWEPKSEPAWKKIKPPSMSGTRHKPNTDTD